MHGVGASDRLQHSAETSAKKSMCLLILQILLVQYGTAFRFIFALTHFLFRIES